MKLYPGISPIAAARMERIAGSYASMSNLEQLSFTQNLREARRKGARAHSIKGKVESNGTEETQQEARDAQAVEGADSEIVGDAES